MARITLSVLGRAIAAVNAMGMAERVALSDEVFARQPNLLASVLALQRFGATLPQIEVALHVLLVAYQAIKTSGHVWPVISEDTQERCLQRLTASMRFAEGLSPELANQAMQQSIVQHAEQPLLAFAYANLREHDLLSVRTEAEKYLLLAVLNLVECIAHAAPRAKSRCSR